MLPVKYIDTFKNVKYKNKKEIYDKFYTEIYPEFEKYEKKRKKILFRTLFITCILITIVASYIYFYKEGFNFYNYNPFIYIFSWMLTLGCILGIWYCLFRVNYNFQKELQKAFMPKIMEYFGKVHYSSKHLLIPEEVFMRSTLFGRFNEVYPDDYFSGIYNKTHFEVAEVKFMLNGRRFISTSFKGVVICFDTNKNIKAKTIVTTASDVNIKNNLPLTLFVFLFAPVLIMIYALDIRDLSFLFNTEDFFVITFPLLLLILMIILIIYLNKRATIEHNVNNKRIKLEDPKFEKRFRVFSEDEIEARYLVTPAFMERFLNLTTSFGTNKAKCSFFNNKIVFAISTKKNLFELGSLYKPLTNPKNMKFFNEFMSIIDMIDYFKLDKKTGI